MSWLSWVKLIFCWLSCLSICSKSPFFQNTGGGGVIVTLDAELTRPHCSVGYTWEDIWYLYKTGQWSPCLLVELHRIDQYEYTFFFSCYIPWWCMNTSMLMLCFYRIVMGHLPAAWGFNSFVWWSISWFWNLDKVIS